jgi:glycosyltransferase involved in cell wall biosynthesis
LIFSNIVGEILPWKGLLKYCRAIQYIESNMLVDSGILFHVVGKSLNNCDYSNQILDIVSSLELLEFKGFISDMASYYESIDVVVHTSLNPDPLPTVILESLSHGNTVIASNVGGVPEILNGLTGNLILDPECSHQDLAKAIVNVSSYTNAYFSKLSTLNKEHISTYFSMDKQSSKFISLLSKVIAYND